MIMPEYYASYKHLFKIKWKICSIGDKPLPRPIPLDGLFVFLLLLVPSILVAAPIGAVLNQNRIALGLVLDGVFTWAALGFDPQGRPFLSFILDLILFFLRGKRRDFSGNVVPWKRRVWVHWDVFDLERGC